MASRCFIAVGMLVIRLVERALLCYRFFPMHVVLVVPTRCSHRRSHRCGPGSIVVMGPLGFQVFGGAGRLDGFQDRRACFSVGSAVRDCVGVLRGGIGVKHEQCDRVYGGVVG